MGRLSFYLRTRFVGPRWGAVSSGERTTSLNRLRMLVIEGGGGDGPVGVNGAGESGDLAEIPGR